LEDETILPKNRFAEKQITMPNAIQSPDYPNAIQSPDYIQKQLVQLADPAYATFMARLLPTLPPQCILGCRIPQLRRLAHQLQELQGGVVATTFLEQLPHRYYDESNLHALLLCELRKLPELLCALNRFLPYVDNWATCDTMACGMNRLRTDASLVLPQVEAWLASDATYTVRFGVVSLLWHYFDVCYIPQHIEWLCAVQHHDYYVDMALAWYFSAVWVDCPELARPIFEQRRLPQFVHNKALQKARESLKLTPQQKQSLLDWKY
jgi:3-methyladenine DNA glycosylase AlkD